jgi:membrane protein DedA with SNARE-associated domain
MASRECLGGQLMDDRAEQAAGWKDRAVRRWRELSRIPRSGHSPESPHDEQPPPGTARLSLLLAVVAVLLVATTAANTLWPILLRDHPLLLPALDGRNRYLFLSSAKVGAVPLVIVGVTRRVIGHVTYYLLGHWYGEAALSWAMRRSRLWRRTITRGEWVMARTAELAVLLSSSNIARTLAGAVGMSPARFVVLETLGTTLQIAALLFVVRSAGERIPQAVGVLDSQAPWLTLLLISAGLGWILWRAAKRRGRRNRLPHGDGGDLG